MPGGTGYPGGVVPGSTPGYPGGVVPGGTGNKIEKLFQKMFQYSVFNIQNI